MEKNTLVKIKEIIITTPKLNADPKEIYKFIVSLNDRLKLGE